MGRPLPLPRQVLVSLLTCLALGAGHPAAAAQDHEDARPRVAILGLRALSGVEEDAALAVSDFIEGQLSELGVYRVMGPQDVQALLGLEAKRQLLGCTEGASCAAEIAGALGVDRALQGSLARIGGSILVSLTLLDSQAARPLVKVSRRVKTEGTLEPVLDAIPGLLREIAAADPATREGAAGPAAEPAGAAGDAAQTRPGGVATEAAPDPTPPADAAVPMLPGAGPWLLTVHVGALGATIGGTQANLPFVGLGAVWRWKRWLHFAAAADLTVLPTLQLDARWVFGRPTGLEGWLEGGVGFVTGAGGALRLGLGGSLPVNLLGLERLRAYLDLAVERHGVEATSLTIFMPTLGLAWVL